MKNFSKLTIAVSSSLFGALTVMLPSEAATFASSSSSFFFSDFSQSPDAVLTDTDSDVSVTSSGEGTAFTDTDAEAFFSQDPDSAFAFNEVFSEVFGEGANYSGTAESEASVLGQFEVSANTIFSFDFLASLDLLTFVDDPASEQAQATGGIIFALLDEAETVLTSFELFGNLDTPGDEDVLLVDSTPDVDWTIDDSIFLSGPDELEETASIVVSGGFSKSFTTPQQLTLVEFKTSDTFVSQEPADPNPAQTPEPGSLIALAALGGVAFSRKRVKAKTA
ncbi:PEP-CTERM sorting domain-containing protein [Leptothoe spongobia]|uniref:PEP-CTERM sorting domain-containing protein n=1 Tax=Leptothoe spongobia TAU-MAC 1115 TaxID=1967444 RepID=A0A947DDD1_9CYAN|nr:PEP-CTERM sorting domain-containing protein [Leptothoe spongobia]MBT9314464.1 PEP-CTERM sorting domain-containing protein [Leptothoe spongobia TAU-MAC 1115]